jgi:hypothetical protein
MNADVDVLQLRRPLDGSNRLSTRVPSPHPIELIVVKALHPKLDRQMGPRRVFLPGPQDSIRETVRPSSDHKTDNIRLSQRQIKALSKPLQLRESRRVGLEIDQKSVSVEAACNLLPMQSDLVDQRIALRFRVGKRSVHVTENAGLHATKTGSVWAGLGQGDWNLDDLPAKSVFVDF